MNDKTLGEYKRTTPDPDETTGEALARLQAELTRLLDEADAELRDEADGGVAAALIEKDALAAAEPRTLTAREHMDAAWEAAHIPADGMIPAGAAYITRNSAGGLRGPFTEGEPLPHTDPTRFVQRRLLDPPRPDGAEDIDEHLRQANAAALGGALTLEQRRALADHLAGFGYRSPIGLAEDGAA